MTKYALIVTCTGPRGDSEELILTVHRAKPSARFYTPKTSFRINIPIDVMLFNSPEAAEGFMQNWKGHNGYIAEPGKYRIIPVEPITSLVGYKEV